MRILCVCDEGVSRSPTIAARLQYSGHDTLAVGVHRASPETLRMLGRWADRVLLTAPGQRAAFPIVEDKKIMVWPIGDEYPRPFNKELLALVDQFATREGLA